MEKIVGANIGDCYFASTDGLDLPVDINTDKKFDPRGLICSIELVPDDKDRFALELVSQAGQESFVARIRSQENPLLLPEADGTTVLYPAGVIQAGWISYRVSPVS